MTLAILPIGTGVSFGDAMADVTPVTATAPCPTDGQVGAAGIPATRRSVATEEVAPATNGGPWVMTMMTEPSTSPATSSASSGTQRQGRCHHGRR